MPERRRRPRRRRLNWTSTDAQVSVVFVLRLAVNTGIAGVYGLPDTALNVYIRSACHIDRSVLQPRVHHSSLHSDNKMLKPLHACYRQTTSDIRPSDQTKYFSVIEITIIYFRVLFHFIFCICTILTRLINAECYAYHS